MKSKLQVNAKVVKWAIIILIPVIILLIPVNDVFTWQIRLFSAATFCTILMFAFEVLPNLIPAMILPVFYILANLRRLMWFFHRGLVPFPGCLSVDFCLRIF